MIIGDINILFFFFLSIFFSLLINTNNSLNLLLTAELLWVTLYAITLFIGFFYDNLNILSLTFFFLVFSAIELGVGLVILLIQNLVTRSANLIENDTNFIKFSTRFSNKIYLNKINWKF